MGVRVLGVGRELRGPFDGHVLQAASTDCAPGKPPVRDDHARTDLARRRTLDADDDDLGAGATLTAEASEGLKPFLLIDAHDPASDLEFGEGDAVQPGVRGAAGACSAVCSAGYTSAGYTAGCSA